MGDGVCSPEASRRLEAGFTPAGVDWIRDRVTDILPGVSRVLRHHYGAMRRTNHGAALLGLRNLSR